MYVTLDALLTLAAVGHAVIPRDVACCEVTVNLPSFAVTANGSGDKRDSVFVVDDLTKHPELKCRPYATEFPNGRYYAGVPITSSAGVNIGAYCILDDKPREGISERDLTFMRDMSQTVMTHLETIRALSEREQNNQMVAGLGDFVRDAPDSQHSSEAKHEPLAASNMPLKNESGDRDVSREIACSIPEAFIDHTAVPLPDTPNSSQQTYFDKVIVQDQQSPQSSPSDALSTMPPGQSPTPAKDTVKAPRQPPSRQPHSRTNSYDSYKVLDDSAKKRLLPYQRAPVGSEQSTYQRASEIMCQSLRIDGVAFLDMSVDTFGGLVPSTDSTTDDSSVNSESTQDDAHSKDAKPCSILGCSEAVARGPVVGNEAHQRKPAKMLTETFMRRLLNRNPKGKIWTFGENLLTHDEDGYSTDNESADSDSSVRPQTPITNKRKSSRRQRRSDGENLQRAFPGTRCIALHGIWDHSRRRWAVAGLYWTFDPLRVLSPETEMHFVTAFSEIVVAETKRLEIYASDKAKSDFISSVSHELRSPLHGILGSVEILAGEKLDNATATLVEQIGSCGHSLLEIIDHLLDFSNLRQQKLAKGAVKSSKIGRKFLPSTADISENDLSSMKTGVALDDLTEDAVVSSVYSFFYDHNTEDRVETSVILDIERADDVAWRCQLATGGWKRVVINLVTNALKYTPAGFIRVSLRRKVKPGMRRRFDAVLSVTDSGKGMSQEFQKNHMFQDFSQEDTLSNGLGLGLHMVSRMVSAMGGTVNVTSDQKGSGTRVTVTVPLEHHPDFNVSADKSSAPLFKSLTGAVKVGIVTVDQNVPLTRNDRLTATSWSMAVASIEKNLDFLGLQPEKCGLLDGNLFDLKIVLDIDLDPCLKALRDDGSEVSYSEFAPMLVVCHNSPSAQKLRRAWAEDPMSSKVAVDFIALPCGVKQMARAVTYTRNLRDEQHLSAKELLKRDLSDPSKLTTGEIHASAVTAHDKTNDLSLPQMPLPGSSLRESLEENQAELGISLPTTSNGQALPERPLPPAQIPTLLPEGDYGPSQGPDMSSLLVPPSGTSPSESPATPPPNDPILLLVDDNRINLQLLVAFAKKHKFRYTAAVDGKVALDAFELSHRKSLLPLEPDAAKTGGEAAGIPTVILMDINMPVMDGYESTQRIRAYENKHHMKPAKIIAFTALQSEAAQMEAFGSGFDMFLSKPIKLKSLAKLIQD